MDFEEVGVSSECRWFSILLSGTLLSIWHPHVVSMQSADLT